MSQPKKINQIVKAYLEKISMRMMSEKNYEKELVPQHDSDFLMRATFDCLTMDVSRTLENFIVKGKNAEIWDSEDNRYLDFVGGYAVLNTGHLHPTVVEKVKNQLNDFSHSCFAFAPHENAVKLSEELNKRYPITSDTKTFMVNSGAEAVENAVKIARYYTNKKSIISFKGGFHGRTYLAMGLTGKDKPYKEGFGPFPEFVKHALYPYSYRDISDDDALASIKDLFKKTLNPVDTAAVVV